MTDRTRDPLNAFATPEGIIAAVAMDQRGSLRRALHAAAGSDGASFEAADLAAFKVEVVEALTPHATAALLDPAYGLEAARSMPSGRGLLLAYEESGYDTTTPGRHGTLLEGWSVRRLAEAGADGVKLLLYYDPSEDAEINDRKKAFVERVGAECSAEGLPLFLEPVTYDDDVDDALTYARLKPRYVRDTAAEFSKDRYRVSVLKLEIPIDARFTDGLGRPPEATAYDLGQAQRWLAEAADAATKPFIYLSAGVDMDVFVELLELAAASGARYSGVLCGRATWKGAIEVYAREGRQAARAWLEDEGVANIRRLNETLSRHAVPYWRDGARTASP